MLSKNLRSILYYIIGVSFVCLLIEVNKRNPVHMYGTEDLYEVKVAKPGSLETTPKYDAQDGTQRDDEDYEEIIPKRNRGRGRDGEGKGGGKLKGLKGRGKGEWAMGKGKAGGRGFGKRKEGAELRMGNGKNKQSDDDDDDDDDTVNEEERGGKRVRGNKSRLGQKIDKDENIKRKFGRKNRGRNNKMESESSEDPDDTAESTTPETEESDDTDDNDDDTDEDTNDTKDDADNTTEAPEDDDVIKDDDNNTKDDNDSDDDDDTEEDEEENTEEYTPPDPEHSCSSFSLTDEHVARRKQVAEACEKIEEEEGQQRRMYSRLRWAVPQRLLYCPVFKAASTTWLMNYMRLHDPAAETHKSGNLHKEITELFPPPSVFKLRKKIFSESLKFMVVRHPFERVVSAYRDKLAGFSRNPHYLDMRKRIIQRHRKKKKDNSNIPTFHEAVDFLLEELEKLESGKEKIFIDGHFMPYSRRCLPCSMDYDIIIKFETLEEDSNYIIKQCHMEDLLKVSHENNAPTGPKTEQGFKNKSKKVKQGKEKPKEEDRVFVSLDFFKDIPVNKIKQLYRYYRQDFEIFGYSADEYFDQS